MKLPPTAYFTSKITLIKWVMAVLVMVILHLYGLFPQAVESGYSLGLYAKISTASRYITQWIPFSLGDFLYIIVTVGILGGFVRFTLAACKQKLQALWILQVFVKSLYKMVWVYIVFMVLWGLNYRRQPATDAFQLKIPTQYPADTLESLLVDLAEQLNQTRPQISTNAQLPAIYLQQIRPIIQQAYEYAGTEFSFLKYSHLSLKPSLFNSLADYIGFNGYFNPFSGEAQIRTDIPAIEQPFIACHEIAHQLGYASETEANFIGFVAAQLSKNAVLQYSAQLDMYQYAFNQWMLALMAENRHSDTLQFKKQLVNMQLRLDSLVQTDRRAIRQFYLSRQNKVAPIMRDVYDAYLKLNAQTLGLLSYNEVIAWLLAFRQQYPQLWKP
jgi:hypothetical protein